MSSASIASSPPTFLWVEIEAFRGFRDRQRIELDASAVILTGPNGSGKTSFFDAIQWLLLGTLERLEPWRMRKNDEHIVNAFRKDDPAVVRAGLILAGKTVELRRQGRHRAGLLEWSDADGVVRGDEAERRLDLALSPEYGDRAGMRRKLMTSALLQQDVMREVLQDKPPERYRHLASLLGLEAVGVFEAATRRRADRAAAVARDARSRLEGLEQRRRVAAEKLAALQARAAAAPDVSQLRTDVADRLDSIDWVRLQGEVPIAASEAVLRQRTIRALSDELSELSRRASELHARPDTSEPPSPQEIQAAREVAAAATAASDGAQAQAEQAELRFAEGRRLSDALASLAAAALPLLGSHCPVCQQSIDEEDVASHLRELVDQGGIDLLELEQQRGATRAHADEAAKRVADATANLMSLEERSAMFERVSADRERLMDEVGEFLGRADQGAIHFVAADKMRALERDALADAVDALGIAASTLSTLGSALRAVPAADDIESGAAELRRIDAELEAARTEAAVSSAHQEEARTLVRAATRAATAVTRSRFQLLAPLVDDIFSRLDPHPVFKSLNFALDVYREQGVASTVVLDEQGIEANPLLVFSSSQANVAALSCFLALGWAAGAEAMPFVFLDDPLQSLDDVNALGFSDICRHIRGQRQLIVSTHDRRLASLLERKLAPRTEGESTRIVEFTGWARSGPDFRERVVEPQLSVGAERAVVSPLAA